MARALTDQEAAGVAERLLSLAQPARVALIDQLRLHDELSVGELAGALGTTQQNASKHLAVLVRAGILVRRRSGRSTLYRLGCADGPDVIRLVMRQLSRPGQAERHDAAQAGS